MKNRLLKFFFPAFLFCIHAHAQENKIIEVVKLKNDAYDDNTAKTGPVEALKTNDTYTVTSVDTPPSFPGGNNSFLKYFDKNFKMPENSGDVIKGSIFISLIVEENGSLTNIKVIRDIGYGTGEEAIRVMKNCPKWIPAKLNGKSVRTEFIVPIKINSEKKQ
ncbi:energy transducer TonB [Flavobacterium sp. '19STA2R22 D10 B1']|uniref:energy transducer TonB n=1 Tax=Flavobacterium aerium TaxID=3037261 RepID=UPI00278C8C68|nr:energy transducer TonB [Flavobacterium sp. '19STA2R22 D10 B1']